MRTLTRIRDRLLPPPRGRHRRGAPTPLYVGDGLDGVRRDLADPIHRLLEQHPGLASTPAELPGARR